MRDDPAQISNRKFRMSCLEALNFLLKVSRRQRVDFGAPPGFCDALRGFDKQVVVRTDGNDEFANRARTNHVIAEKLEAILEPFRQRRQIRCSVLMKEVDPQSRRQLSLVVQREKRKVHVVVVFMRGTIGRSVCRLKRAFVEMSRHTETHAVIQGIDRTTLALLECEQCLPQCQSSATRSLTAGSDGSVGADGNRRILAFKEFLAATVCCRR